MTFAATLGKHLMMMVASDKMFYVAMTGSSSKQYKH